jgi:hypothetical protein
MLIKPANQNADMLPKRLARNASENLLRNVPALAGQVTLAAALRRPFTRKMLLLIVYPNTTKVCRPKRDVLTLTGGPLLH